jgi:hypothetical protein
MRRDRNIGKGDAKDMAREAKERKEEREEKGLCVRCGENPQNPATSQPYCLSCYSDPRAGRCGNATCLNEAVVRARQIPLCEPHAIERAHELDENIGDILERQESEGLHEGEKIQLSRLTGELEMITREIEQVFPEEYEPNTE